MAKQDNMVQRNREESQAKVGKAIAVMSNLYQNGEQVTVAVLMRKTGLSRAFFYNNKGVHAELRRFQGMQKSQSFVYPQKVALDNAMESTVKLMKKRLADMDAELKRLRAENERLRNAAKASYISVLQEI